MTLQKQWELILKEGHPIAHKLPELATHDYENGESIIANLCSIRSTFDNTRSSFNP